ncbi:MAG: methyltransferase domain-containing protein [bacterium]|nr:methyltransferase domain-containing protein [bacterium]
MYDKKYSRRDETEPRSVVTDYVDSYLTPNQSILDLGSGAGRHSKYLVEKGLRVTAIDMSRIGVKKTKEILNKHPESNALVADARHLPFEDTSFDSLISNRVLDYNDDEGLESAFSEIERVLKVDGTCLITVRSTTQPSKENESLVMVNELGGKTFAVTTGDEQGNFQHYFSEQEVRDLGERHHMEVQDIREKQKINKRGEFKAEWQIIMRKVQEADSTKG